MNRNLFLFGLLGLCSTVACAAPTLDDNIRSMLTDRVQSGELSSVVIGVIDGKDSAVFGFGKVGKDVPNGKTVYEIGSVTKTFTALLLANAVKAGRATLDEPVAKLLPGYVIPEFEGKPISPLDLATQSSGLPRLPDNLLPKQMDNPYADYSAANLKNFLEKYHLPRQPGALYEYSNLGFGLLGFALSEQGKTSYADLVKKQITTPLGMVSTDVALSPTMRARLAPGHDSAGKQAGNWDMDAIAGAGALRSDTQDLIRYLQALMHLKGGDASPFALVQKAQRATTLPDTRIGLAWNITPVRDQSVVWHNGMTGGYASYVGFTADGRRGVVILTNTARSVDDIGFASLAPGAKPAPRQVALPPALLADYIGRYELAPRFVLTVKQSAIGLTAQATGQPAFPIFASAPDEFFLREVDAQLSFKRSPAGVIESVVLHQNGHHTPGRKLPNEAPPVSVQLEPAVLKQYTGTYMLQMGLALAITVVDNQLYGQAIGQARVPLQASALDEFFYEPADIKISFNRDDKAGVKSLILHQGGGDIKGEKQSH